MTLEEIMAEFAAWEGVRNTVAAEVEAMLSQARKEKARMDRGENVRLNPRRVHRLCHLVKAQEEIFRAEKALLAELDKLQEQEEPRAAA